MVRRRTLLAGLLIAFCTRRRAATQDSGSAVKLHRLVIDGSHPDLLLKLPTDIAILEALPEDPDSLLTAYREGFAANQAIHAAGQHIYALCAGPLLDQPDRVEPLPLKRIGRDFSLLVMHTQVRLTGAQLRKNIVWRPLIEVRLPGPLDPGRYVIDVVWQARRSLPDGPALAAPVTTSRTFEVRS